VVSEAATERFWWDGLTPAEILLNTAGYPPYDASRAAGFILDAIGPLTGFARLLDLGCGEGRLTAEVAEIVPSTTEVVGVDISHTMIQRASTRPPLHDVVYRIGDGRNLPERCGMFDGAWSVAMFQHIPWDAKIHYIADVCDHLRSGATFAFTVAVGDEDMFLNHQLTEDDLAELVTWMSTIFDNVTRYFPVDENGWTWIEATK